MRVAIPQLTCIPLLCYKELYLVSSLHVDNALSTGLLPQFNAFDSHDMSIVYDDTTPTVVGGPGKKQTFIENHETQVLNVEPSS